MELEKIRENINIVDTKLVRLLAERDALIKEITPIKKKHNLAISDHSRENQLLANVQALASERGLDPDYTESLFRLILEESKRLQRWR